VSLLGLVTRFPPARQIVWLPKAIGGIPFNSIGDVNIRTSMPLLTCQ